MLFVSRCNARSKNLVFIIIETEYINIKDTIFMHGNLSSILEM